MHHFPRSYVLQNRNIPHPFLPCWNGPKNGKPNISPLNRVFLCELARLSIIRSRANVFGKRNGTNAATAITLFIKNAFYTLFHNKTEFDAFYCGAHIFYVPNLTNLEFLKYDIVTSAPSDKSPSFWVSITRANLFSLPESTGRFIGSVVALITSSSVMLDAWIDAKWRNNLSCGLTRS